MSTDSTHLKSDTFHIRTAKKDKDLIEKAAEHLGLTASAYMLQNALKAARNDLAAVGSIQLSKADAAIFLEALNMPPKPNKALKSAFAIHKKLTKK